MLRAGAASLDITPSPGHAIPGQWLCRTAERVRDPLLVNALVLESDGVRAGIVSCDVGSLKNRVVQAVRSAVRGELGIPPERLILHATHTHTGPPIMEALGTPCEEDCVARVQEAVVRSISQAAAELQEASVAWGATSAPGLAFPRRFHMADGTVVMHPAKDDPNRLRPEGVPDDTLTAMGVFAADGTAIALAANFACHPICVGGASYYSGDYPGVLCRGLAGLWPGRPVGIYLNGFAGDIGPDDVDSDASGYGEEAMERLGVALAARAAAVLASAPRHRVVPIEGRIRQCTLGIRRPAPESLREAREALGDDLTTIPQDVQLIRYREMLLLEREAAANPSVQAEIIGLRVGDGLLIGWQGEVFSAYSRRIRQVRGGRPTAIVSLVNGAHGYVPTPESFSGGGYETWLVRSSKLEPLAGDRLLSQTMELLTDKWL